MNTMQNLPAGRGDRAPETDGARHSRLGRLAAWVGAAAVLGAVFAAWLDPQMAFALATRAWACL